MTTSDAAASRHLALAASLGHGIISTDRDGRIQLWNTAATAIFGYAAADVHGRPFTDLVAPDERPEVSDMLRRVAQGGTAAREGLRCVRPDGTPVEVALAASPLRAADDIVMGASLLARDVTRERDLERHTMHLAAIVDSSDDAIVSKDLRGTILSWNRAAERMFGYPASEAVGRWIGLIIPEERLAEEDYVLGQIRAGSAVSHFETVRRHKDGSLLEISLTVSPVRRADGTIVGASKIARDITTQKQLLKEVEQASRLKDEFLATLSHELRTPLNAVIGYARMLRTGTVPGERLERAVELIDRNAQILGQLVSDVLDMSSIVAGKTRLQIAPCDVARIVEEAVDIVRHAAQAKEIDLTCATDESLTPLAADADRLRQVFWNLLTNAVKFTPAGGRVRVTHFLDSAGQRIVVADTGIGLSPESIPQIFERFRQVDAEGKAAPGGLGLGLALVRHFVELHGGTVTASSPGPGQGTTFTVTLPVRTTGT